MYPGSNKIEDNQMPSYLIERLFFFLCLNRISVLLLLVSCSQKIALCHSSEHPHILTYLPKNARVAGWLRFEIDNHVMYNDLGTVIVNLRERDALGRLSPVVTKETLFDFLFTCQRTIAVLNICLF